MIKIQFEGDEVVLRFPKEFASLKEVQEFLTWLHTEADEEFTRPCGHSQAQGRTNSKYGRSKTVAQSLREKRLPV
jgi:hypothetical protein